MRDRNYLRNVEFMVNVNYQYLELNPDLILMLV